MFWVRNFLFSLCVSSVVFREPTLPTGSMFSHQDEGSTQNQPPTWVWLTLAPKSSLLNKKTKSSKGQLPHELVSYSGLHYLTQWQGFFEENSEAESSYWACQRLQKSSRKRKKGAQKNHHAWDSAHSLYKTRLVTLDTDAHPLGFDSLACEMGELLPVELSGFWRSNRNQGICFENTGLCSDVRGAWDVALQKAFYLFLSSDPLPPRGAHLPTILPAPSPEGTKPNHSTSLLTVLCPSPPS